MGIITVSRTHGSAGTMFARELAERLNYQCIDRKFIDSVCRIRDDHVCAFGLEDERSPSFLQRLEELMTNRNFHKLALMANVYDYALEGNVVFIGMGAEFILSGLTGTVTLEIVRLLSDRVKAIGEIKHISFDDALDLIEKMDHGKKEFIAHYFDKNVHESTHYHLTINSSHVTLENAVDLVCHYCGRFFTPERTTETEQQLRNRLLEKRAEILLFRLGLVHDYGKVTFEAKQDGVLTVRGVIGGEHEKQKLLDTLKTIKEVHSIEDQVKIGILSRNIY
jgi:cytidylate kinase